MTYLLDTCVISTLRKKTPRGKKLYEWFRDYDREMFFVSALTIGELHYGIVRLSHNNEKGVRNALQNWLFSEVIPSFEDRILPIDHHISTMWGTMKAQAESKGVTLPIVDAFIAVTAIRYELIVVTQNTKHFEMAGARVFDPLA